MTIKNYTEEAIENQVPPSSKVLTQKALVIPVNTITKPAIQEIIDRMYRVTYGRQGDADFPTLVGLAAPQIGILKRIVIIGINAVGGGEQPTLREFINPVIFERSKSTEIGREGCFSTSRVCGIVERAKWVRVKAYDRFGNEFTIKLSGFPARVAQHEIDHLSGIRFPDRITDDSRLHRVEENEFGDYRKNWQHWTVNCPRSKWEAIKYG